MKHAHNQYQPKAGEWRRRRRNEPATQQPLFLIKKNEISHSSLSFFHLSFSCLLKPSSSPTFFLTILTLHLCHIQCFSSLFKVEETWRGAQNEGDFQGVREWKEEENLWREGREKSPSLLLVSFIELFRLIKMYSMIRHSFFFPIVGSWHCCVCMSCTARGVGTKRVSLSLSLSHLVSN